MSDLRPGRLDLPTGTVTFLSTDVDTWAMSRQCWPNPASKSWERSWLWRTTSASGGAI